MISGGPAYLIDTNVLVYAYDTADALKQLISTDVLRRLANGRGAFSVQVLGEFFVNVTRKPRFPLTPEEARRTSINLCRSWPVLDLDVRTYLDAVRAVDAHRLSFWDALVWGTAMQNGVPFIVTEDQQHERLVEDVRYLNPFTSGFDLARLS
jgi:predicted nucleic acid-binding protein